jgi:hypothetical protein
MTPQNEWKSWLRKLGNVQKPRAIRRVPSGFAARRRNDPAAKPATIRNISTSGLHLWTEERWPLGELVPLTVEVERLSEGPPEPQFAMQARVVRHAKDGMGLSFVLPQGLDESLWDGLLKRAIFQTDTDVILHSLRMIRTVLFLSRLCHAEARDAIRLLGGEMDPPRTEKAMEIAHGAEKLLDAEPDADRKRANPQLVAKIIKHGSWADDFTKQLWAGLLATSCTVDGADSSSNDFVDLLVNVTHHQSRIFIHACLKALELMPGNEYPPMTRIILSPEAMIQITGMYDVPRIATDVAYLFNFGILDKVFDFTSYLPMESFDLTPSRLGLELFKRCNGHLVNRDLPFDLLEGADFLSRPKVSAADEEELPPPLLGSGV